MVAEPGQVVAGVGLQGELQELVGLAASAFPPVDEGDGGQDGGGTSTGVLIVKRFHGSSPSAACGHRPGLSDFGVVLIEESPLGIRGRSASCHQGRHRRVPVSGPRHRFGLTFTRSRSGNKNDGAHVEQKNWQIVRQTVGYHRYDTAGELELRNRIWALQRLLTNHFGPQQKLVAKVRTGAKISKKYDTRATPFQRVLADTGTVSREVKTRLRRENKPLNPAAIQRQIQALCAELLTLTAAKQSRNPSRPSGQNQMIPRSNPGGHLDMIPRGRIRATTYGGKNERRLRGCLPGRGQG